jgi:GPH family glycoside/pentoside/hexuronide:cation symporter
MSKEKKKSTEGYSNRKAIAYSTGQIADQAAYQSFTILVFVFYYAVVGIDILLITIGFVIWSFWNSFNDPMLGWLSDRTHTKYGRRLPYIIIAIIPLGITLILLFTPPLSIGITDMASNFIYFMIIIIVFEFWFTMYALNATSLFPETFITEEERTAANNVRQALLIVGLALGIILPGLVISDYSNPAALPEYQLFGVIIAILVIAIGFIFAKFTPREKTEFSDDYKSTPPLFASIKNCVKSKSFKRYIPAEVANWFVYTMLATIVPLYGKYVLGITDALLLSLLLGITFLSSALFITIIWKPIVRKKGTKRSWIMSMTIWIITLIPLMFINDLIGGLIVFFLVGLGLSGSLYIVDLVVSDIIDEDEVNTGTRRDAGFYGVNAFFLRLSSVIVFLAIGPLFIIGDWQVFDPSNITPEIILILRILMSLLPIIALVIAILSIMKYPLDGERLKKVREELEKIHAEKKSKV